MWNFSTPKSVCVGIEQKMADFRSEHDNVGRNCLEDEKQTLTSLQNLLKKSSVSRACLSSQTYTACVGWCGVGHKELSSSQGNQQALKGVLPTLNLGPLP